MPKKGYKIKDQPGYKRVKRQITRSDTGRRYKKNIQIKVDKEEKKTGKNKTQNIQDEYSFLSKLNEDILLSILKSKEAYLSGEILEQKFLKENKNLVDLNNEKSNYPLYDFYDKKNNVYIQLKNYEIKIDKNNEFKISTSSHLINRYFQVFYNKKSPSKNVNSVNDVIKDLRKKIAKAKTQEEKEKILKDFYKAIFGLDNEKADLMFAGVYSKIDYENGKFSNINYKQEIQFKNEIFKQDNITFVEEKENVFKFIDNDGRELKIDLSKNKVNITYSEKENNVWEVYTSDELNGNLKFKIHDKEKVVKNFEDKFELDNKILIKLLEGVLIKFIPDKKELRKYLNKVPKGQKDKLKDLLIAAIITPTKQNFREIEKKILGINKEEKQKIKNVTEEFFKRLKEKNPEEIKYTPDIKDFMEQGVNELRLKILDALIPKYFDLKKIKVDDKKLKNINNPERKKKIEKLLKYLYIEEIQKSKIKGKIIESLHKELIETLTGVKTQMLPDGYEKIDLISFGKKDGQTNKELDKMKSFYVEDEESINDFIQTLKNGKDVSIQVKSANVKKKFGKVKFGLQLKNKNQPDFEDIAKYTGMEKEFIENLYSVMKNKYNGAKNKEEKRKILQKALYLKFLPAILKITQKDGLINDPELRKKDLNEMLDIFAAFPELNKDSYLAITFIKDNKLHNIFISGKKIGFYPENIDIEDKLLDKDFDEIFQEKRFISIKNKYTISYSDKNTVEFILKGMKI